MSTSHPEKPKLLIKNDQSSGDSLPEEQSNLPFSDSPNTLSSDSQPLKAADNFQGGKIGVGSVFAGPEASPPFPEGIVADRNRVYVAGPAAFGDNGGKPSEVRVFNQVTGQLLSTILLRSEILTEIHGVAGLTVDGQHRVYVVSNQLGIIRLTPFSDGYRQEIYSPVLPEIACNPSLPPSLPCSLPNEIAFGPDGYLYWSDSFQNTIFRVPPGGGVAESWFHSDRLAGSATAPFPVGPNGIKVTPDGAELYVAATTSASAPGGAIYRLPFVNAPQENDLKIFHQYLQGEMPDGIAFGQSGKLYVALQSPSEVSILTPDGEEGARLKGPINSPIAYDAPANFAFDNRGSVLVTNHALFSGNPAAFAVLKVFVGDRGVEVEVPPLP
ncbi:SMP-30/gluconolactonase/LRE family protein [Nodosilinea sp. LEGE 07088]|uniref:SMP-30/gluconolactonase/LRE family protein n=1 Tax=Nodosilinea sp. LEGE 07088 TaxID=2777968 RepID=UPI001881A92D|nr:SMP-30/gluconolactonase/LRE family protein [Nodosilinea sp. LEGE 07088]MBE9139179.1 SMP-30/gluconolactonase/LRE family protein [Nodosilinea sp. LEGE 07088]